MFEPAHSGKARFDDFRANKRVRRWLLAGLRMITIDWPLAWLLGYAGNTLGIGLNDSKFKLVVSTQIINTIFIIFIIHLHNY